MKILLTGASSGIGAAFAQLSLDQGHQVLGVSRNPDQLLAGVTPIKADLTQTPDISAIFQQCGQIDALINCAGIAYLSPISSGDPSQWEEMWQVNVHALALACQLALSKLNHYGSIINVSSMSGWRVPPSGGFYSPTKFAVRAITEALRSEQRAIDSTLRIGSISPGFVDTPLLDHYFQGREQQLIQQRKSMQMLSPHDIAQSILHILESPLHVEIGDIQLRSTGQSI